MQTEMRTDRHSVVGEESRSRKPDCKPSKDVRDAAAAAAAADSAVLYVGCFAISQLIFMFLHV